MGETKKPGADPEFDSDIAAERFDENANLAAYDLSDMRPMRFEFERGGMSGKAVRHSLKSELKRTGMTVIALLKDAKDLPDGLNVRAVNRWISGSEQPERRSQFDYVLGKLRALPDAPPGLKGHVAGRPGRRHPRPGEEWIEVTAEMATQLRAEMVRTTLSFEAIAYGTAEKPEGLTPRIVRGWLGGDAKTTRKAHWEFVMQRLMIAPDGGPLPPLTRKRQPKEGA